MINIYLSGTTRTPIYQQIVTQVKQLIASSNLKPGEHLPTVRQLAHHLHINPGTVSRAYSELERQGIVVSRRGGGTIVSARVDDPRVLMLRQRHLSNMVSNNILDAFGSQMPLSSGKQIALQLAQTCKLALNRTRYYKRPVFPALSSFDPSHHTV